MQRLAFKRWLAAAGIFIGSMLLLILLQVWIAFRGYEIRAHGPGDSLFFGISIVGFLAIIAIALIAIWLSGKMRHPLRLASLLILLATILWVQFLHLFVGITR